MREKDEKQVFGPKHARLPNDPKGSSGLDMKSRGDYVKLKYQGNAYIIGRKKNQVATAMDYWQTSKQLKAILERGQDLKLQELAGVLKEKASTYDLRRLSTLKFFLI